MIKNRKVLIRDISWDTNFEMDESDKVAAFKLEDSATLQSGDFFYGQIAQNVDPLSLQNDGDKEEEYLTFCDMALNFLSGETGFCINSCVIHIQ